MALIPMESSESKESVVARVGHPCRTRVGQAALDVTLKEVLLANGCTVSTQTNVSAMNGRSRQCTRLLADGSSAALRHGASLRHRLALSFGKAKRCHCEMPIWRCNASHVNGVLGAHLLLAHSLGRARTR